MRFNLLFVIILLLLISTKLFSKDTAPSIEVGAYLDTYFATDNDKLSDSLGALRQFSYANPKKNQFALNIAQISAKVKYESLIRSNVTLQFGDLPQTAWTDFGAKYPMIQQANAGVQFCENWWLDAGLFLTHIGGESLLPKDNWLSSHSLVTYYEPFYQAGVKVAYETEKFTACFHILNGNGIIEDNNYNKTFGLYLSYTPSALYSVSYAGVIGNEEPGSPVNSKTNILNNVVGQYNPSDNLSIKGQLDYGMKQIVTGGDKTGKYLGASLTGHYLFTKDISGTLRFAYADNSDAIYFPVVKGMDISLGVEYKPSADSFIRLEGRTLQLDSKYKYFFDGQNNAASRMEMILNMGVWIN